MAFFADIQQNPADPIFALTKEFIDDGRHGKVNLGIGIYCDEEQNLYEFPSIATAEQRIAYERTYLPLDGNKDFITLSQKLVFGEKTVALAEGRISSAQALGGTGALRVGGEFLAQHVGKKAFIPDKTWINHRAVFTRCGMDVQTYPYWDAESRDLDFSGLCSSITAMEEGSIVILHACCHNPTGTDPSKEEWKELSALMKKHKIIPFFDFAYQGFGEGIEEDAWAVRHFVEEGHEMLVASSNSKNFGLYGERVGMLSVVCHNKTIAENVGTNIKKIIRPSYSNPPRHGAALVAEVLGDDTLKTQWEKELSEIRHRIKAMREALIKGLEDKKADIDIDFMKNQKGMFSFGFLNEKSAGPLKEKHGIYFPDNGRINVAGLTENNMEYVVEAILEAL